MKSSQTSLTTALAILLAVSVVLFGRLVTGKDMNPPPRAVSPLEGTQLMYLSNSSRDGMRVNVVSIGAHQVHMHGQRSLSLGRALPRVEVANDGTILTHETAPGISRAVVRHVMDFNARLEVTGCQFTALSPNGRMIACANGTEVKVSPTDRLQWRSVRQGATGTVFGAPRLFNEAILVTHAVGLQVDLVVVSLLNNATLAYLDPEQRYVFSRSGMHAASLDSIAAELTLHDFRGQSQQTFYLPEDLTRYTVEPVALSDDAKQVLLYVVSDKDSARMVVWNLDVGMWMWLTVYEVPGNVSGQFDPSGRFVVFAVRDNVYAASVCDGRVRWINSGSSPTWLVR